VFLLELGQDCELAHQAVLQLLEPVCASWFPLPGKRCSHSEAKFNTVAGNFSFAQDGEWSQTRQVWTQFQNVQPNNLDQFRDCKVQPIVWPIESKSGDLIYPYADARKK
jgi:hypothetical protein